MKTSADRARGGAGAPRLDRTGRRRFLALFGGAAAGAGLLALEARLGWAFGNYRPDPGAVVKRFAFAQLRYAATGWNPYPTAPGEFARELERMTSVEAFPAAVEVSLAGPELFTQPFLCLAGHGEFPALAAAESERLRLWLEAGGTLLVDDSAGAPGGVFDASTRRELARALPGARTERLTADHTVFKSFFLVRTVSGARLASPFLEGIPLQGRTAVVFSPNNLLGAFARDPLGRWIEPCAPGGERQRRLALHLGVNIVMYALCGDYKQDRIHVPFLRQRS